MPLAAMGTMTAANNAMKYFRNSDRRTGAASRWIESRTSSSFDDFVSHEQNGLRQIDAEDIGRFQIDRQLERRRLLDRQIARIRSLENPVDMKASRCSISA